MNIAPTPAPDHTAMLGELAALGMRVARVVARVMEIEQAVVEVVVGFLPSPGVDPKSIEAAIQDGREADSAIAVLGVTVPRLQVLALAYDRVARSVRRIVALMRRMEAGWPRAGSDDRAAMVRRQVTHGVAAVIGRERDGEAAERLFDDLAERLDDPGFEAELLAMPIEAAVRRVCLDLGLVAEGLSAGLPGEEVGGGSAGVRDTC